MTGTITWPASGWTLPPLPAALGGGGTVARTTGPQGPDAMGPVGVVGSIVLAVLGPKIFDHYITRPLVERDILSPRSAPFFTASAVLGSLRLFGPGAVWKAVQRMPQFTAIKKIVDTAYDATGSPRNEWISLGLEAVSVSPFAIAYAYPKSFVARALTSGAGGVLSGAGGVLLIDQLSEPVLSGGVHLYFDFASDLPERDATLWDMSVLSAQEVVSEELTLGEYLPNIALASHGLISFWDQHVWKIEGTKYNNVKAMIETRFDAKMEALRAASEGVGKSLNDHLYILQSLNLPWTLKADFRVDWDGFRRSVLTFYRQNREQLHQAYQLPYDILPGDAATIVKLIDQDGFITDLEALKFHLLGINARRLKGLEIQLDQKASDLGIEVKDEKDIPQLISAFCWNNDASSSSEDIGSPEALYGQQIAFLEGEGRDLTLQIGFLKKIIEALRIELEED